jgi:DNA-binding response OmpR family regulator
MFKVVESKTPQRAALAILIVDDNPAVTKALSLLLQGAGYDPIACACGAEALQYADGNTPAAAVVDIHLPDINGLILSRTLRERFGPTTPIIVVSGDTSMETIKSLTHVGATYFFSKPLNSGYLIERLKELLTAA